MNAKRSVSDERGLSTVFLVMRRLLTSVLLFGLAAVDLFPTESIAGPFGATQCAASRFGSNLGCTANDVQLNSITVLGSPPSSCVGGGTLPLDLNVTINFGYASRYDIGVFLSNNGADPALTTASSCSVGVLPTSSPFLNLDGDSCGDGNSNITGSFVMNNVAVPCTTDGSGNTTLYIPYVITWDISTGNFCGDNTYPVPTTTSKCNKGSVTFPPGTTIIVLPAITKTDGRTTVRSGDSLTYTIVISSSTGSTVSGAVFTDPAVANLSISGVSCTAAGGATCPAGPTVSAMQGAGIALPNMPGASTLTFTVTGTYTGTPTSPTTLTNTASVTLSGQTNSASDTDTVMVPPTVTKSFSLAAIISGGTSILTVTLTNPTTTVDITGAAFTDNYPGGMTNSSTPTLTNSCGGTATAVANGSSLSLSGATIPKGASCTVTVRVTATASGSNSTGAVTSANAASGSSASATLQVISATNSTLVAVPTSVANDGVSTSTITATLKDAVGNPVAGKTMTLTAGSGSSIITTVSGTTDVNGQATFTVKDSTAETVTYTAHDTTDGINITQTASVTFSSVNSFNAFESSTAAIAITGSIYTKLAGAAFSLDVVAIAGSNKASGFNGNVKAELLANTGAVGSGYGANNCPTSNSVIQTIASAAIASGRSAVSFAAVANAYRDVRVRISYPTASPTITVCSNDSFTIRPPSFTVTSTNATNTNTSGTPVIKTGANFNLTAASVAGYDGTPSIDTSKVAGSTNPGTIVGSFSAAPSATGTASGAGFTYDEVGSFGLNANAVYDSNFTVVDKPNDCTNDFSNTLVGGKFGCSIGSTAVAQTTGSSGFGRFIPDHFDITTVTPGCNSVFTYTGLMPVGLQPSIPGQPFTVRVTARNQSGTTTRNYDGPLGYSKETTFSDAGTAANFTGNTLPAAGYTLGVGQNSIITYRFTSKEAAPQTLTLRAVDTDSVSSAGHAELTTVVRSGRVHIFNAYGSELVDLPLPMRAEHYDASSGWITNPDDGCTSVALGNLTPSNPIPVVGSSPAKTTNASITNATFVMGDAGLQLSAPMTGGTGYVDLTADLDLAAKAWMKYDWSGTGSAANPTGRATFGLYRGSPKSIYLRERY